ncbi:GNAT family N-acetyltransferase [Streptomyces aidingensis]|uniref:Lysine N-acyltransferase MbtK n=1 Tax=Streptomyces aidingensis TaxID=910347 RepID=A0A1I1IKH3_9ACTN|nr:GNAT family N-acetyltransferase [Streptomyces aidingensis]SFC34273.1 Acetyltransferase (GNAT) domain-containing protein [Streptomyces aidingensis]
MHMGTGEEYRAPAPSGAAGEQETVELPAPPAPPRTPSGPPGGDLLDGVPDWGPAAVADGPVRRSLRLRPVRPQSDLPLLTAWFGGPAAEFWEPPRDPAERLAALLSGDGREVPCLGLLDGAPAGYWELYRADLSVLAGRFPCLPHDTGMRVLLAPALARRPGPAAALLAAAGELVLHSRPACRRVLAAPDVRDGAVVTAHHRAGFRTVTELTAEAVTGAGAGGRTSPARRIAVLVRER